MAHANTAGASMSMCHKYSVAAAAEETSWPSRTTRQQKHPVHADVHVRELRAPEAWRTGYLGTLKRRVTTLRPRAGDGMVE